MRFSVCLPSRGTLLSLPQVDSAKLNKRKDARRNQNPFDIVHYPMKDSPTCSDSCTSKIQLPTTSLSIHDLATHVAWLVGVAQSALQVRLEESLLVALGSPDNALWSTHPLRLIPTTASETRLTTRLQVSRVG